MNFESLSSNSSKFSCQDSISVKEEKILTWHNINVSPPKPSRIATYLNKTQPNSKKIIDNISGYSKSGSLTALMGPSGSGKTTLLNFLSKRLGTSFKSSGTVLLNGEYIKIKSNSCYIKQEDIFYNLMTIEEHMLFNANLKLGKTHSLEERKEIVDKLINKFEMYSKRETRITDTDSSVKGLSGGQRRRITIMTELITNPIIIFADEPTTGLDSYLADSVVSILKDLANDGHIVICTIHQPTSYSFSMFDDLVLIAKGLPIYMGSLSECTSYLNTIGYEIPENTGISDHFIRLVSIEPLSVEQSYKRIQDISNSFIENPTESFEIYVKDVNCIYNKQEKTFTKRVKRVFTIYKYQSTIWTQFIELIKRNVKCTFRQPLTIFYKFLQEVIVGFIIGIIYSNVRYRTSNAGHYPGIMFFETAAFSLNAVLAAAISIPNEFEIFAKEHRNNLYQSALYFLAKTLGELPIQLAQSLVVTLFIYFLGHLRPEVGAFFLHFLVLSLSYQCALSFGYLVSCIAGNSTSSIAITTPLMLPFLLFGGFLLREKFIPPYFIWIRWISWMIYTFDSFMIINFKGGYLKCNSGDCLKNGEDYELGDKHLNGFVLRQDFFTYNIIILFFLVIIYRILAVYVLILKIKYRNKTQQT